MSEHQFPTPQPVELEIKVASGDFHVTSTEADESTVTIEGDGKLLDSITVELTGNRLTVEQHLRGLGGLFMSNGSVTVTASVPDHSTVRVATASGDTQLDGTFDGVDMSSASGDIDVRGTIDGPVRTKTASGDTQVTRVSGDVALETVSGDLNLEAAEGSVTVKSVSGDVRVDSLRDGHVTVNNVSGDIELGIAAGSRVDIDASSLSGDLESEVPLSGEDGSDDDDGPMVVIRSNTVSGDFRLFRAR
jgi:DUF4097 and DUF4098 domain-containing protein YvlB